MNKKRKHEEPTDTQISFHGKRHSRDLLEILRNAVPQFPAALLVTILMEYIQPLPAVLILGQNLTQVMDLELQSQCRFWSCSRTTQALRDRTDWNCRYQGRVSADLRLDEKGNGNGNDVLIWHNGGILTLKQDGQVLDLSVPKDYGIPLDFPYRWQVLPFFQDTMTQRMRFLFEIIDQSGTPYGTPYADHQRPLRRYPQVLYHQQKRKFALLTRKRFGESMILHGDVLDYSHRTFLPSPPCNYRTNWILVQDSIYAFPSAPKESFLPSFTTNLTVDVLPNAFGCDSDCDTLQVKWETRSIPWGFGDDVYAYPVQNTSKIFLLNTHGIAALYDVDSRLCELLPPITHSGDIIAMGSLYCSSHLPSPPPTPSLCSKRALGRQIKMSAAFQTRKEAR